MLAAAHGKIEKRFLESGAVMISIVEILRKLTGSLDTITGALDGDTASRTLERIDTTANDLSCLTQIETERQEGFDRLSIISGSMRGNISDMRETMRYLRTFATTVKITGAGLDEFAGFADEIRERIHSGSDEVEKIAAQLQAMNVSLEKARTLSGKTRQSHMETVPRIVNQLHRDSSRIKEHHRNLVSTAGQVKKLAGGIQMKIATVLSALQIGDITRQRMEHIIDSLRMLEEFRNSAAAAALPVYEQDHIADAVCQLAAAQMEQTFEDFRRECRNIVVNMARFTDDTKEILALRDEMTRDNDAEARNFMRVLESGVGEALALTGHVQETSRKAGETATGAAGTARDLLASIGIIQAIKTDIHYMALNSNLRCSRLGDAGRSVNVVSGELRIFAGKLEEPADNIIAGLRQLEQAASQLSDDPESAGMNVSAPLSEALDTLRTVSEKMDGGLAALATEGQEVFTRVSSAIGTLDFESELGEILQNCVSTSAAMTTGVSDSIPESDAAQELGERIHRLYTMAQEREIHRMYMPVSGNASPAPVSVADDDDMDGELF